MQTTIHEREPAPGPDWSAIEHPVPCPLCDYDLRGLREPRCPECDGRFEWSEVVDPHRQEHPYLFEHHPERNWWSLRRTAWGACRPRAFWTSLHPAQKGRRGRLLLYWLIGATLLMVTPLGFLATLAHLKVRLTDHARAEIVTKITTRRDAAIRAAQGRPDQEMRIDQAEQEYDSWLVEVNRSYPRTNTLKMLARAYAAGWLFNGYTLIFGSAVLLPLAWAWLTYLVMRIFRWTMRRRRLKRLHLLRCAIYSFDPIPLAVFYLVAAPIAAALPIEHLTRGWVFAPPALLHQLCLFPLLAWLILSWLRFGTAVRYYLQFDHPRATVITSQCIVGIIVLLSDVGATFQLMRLLRIYV